MTSLSAAHQNPQNAGSAEASATHYAVTRLDPFLYQEMRWCADCGGEQRFFPCFEFEGGRVGVCEGCGEEKVQQFTRTNSEAA